MHLDLAMPRLRLAGWGRGVFSSPRSTPFPQSTSRRSTASLLIWFLTAWSNEDGLRVNGVMILFYRQPAGTSLSEKPR